MLQGSCESKKYCRIVGKLTIFQIYLVFNWNGKVKIAIFHSKKMCLLDFIEKSFRDWSLAYSIQSLLDLAGKISRGCSVNLNLNQAPTWFYSKTTRAWPLKVNFWILRQLDKEFKKIVKNNQFGVFKAPHRIHFSSKFMQHTPNRIKCFRIKKILRGLASHFPS